MKPFYIYCWRILKLCVMCVSQIIPVPLVLSLTVWRESRTQSIALITGNGDTVMANMFAGRDPASNAYNGRHAKE